MGTLNLDLTKLMDSDEVEIEIDSNTFGWLGKIRDYTGELFEEDKSRLENSTENRRFEFSTGRYFSKRALDSLGINLNEPIGVDERRPVWPDGVHGSISHSDEMAIVVVSCHPGLKGIGVDIEAVNGTPEGLKGLVFTENELLFMAKNEQPLVTLTFSAKEAVFKAVNPINKVMVGFQEVELEFEFETQRFSASYVGSNEVNKNINDGVGQYGFYRNHVVSWFVLD